MCVGPICMQINCVTSGNCWKPEKHFRFSATLHYEYEADHIHLSCCAASRRAFSDINTTLSNSLAARGTKKFLALLPLGATLHCQGSCAADALSWMWLFSVQTVFCHSLMHQLWLNVLRLPKYCHIGPCALHNCMPHTSIMQTVTSMYVIYLQIFSGNVRFISFCVILSLYSLCGSSIYFIIYCSSLCTLCTCSLVKLWLCSDFFVAGLWLGAALLLSKKSR